FMREVVGQRVEVAVLVDRPAVMIMDRTRGGAERTGVVLPADVSRTIPEGRGPDLGDHHKQQIALVVFWREKTSVLEVGRQHLLDLFVGELRCRARGGEGVDIVECAPLNAPVLAEGIHVVAVEEGSDSALHWGLIGGSPITAPED